MAQMFHQEQSVVGPFCYWADRTKSPGTIQRTRTAVVKLLRQENPATKNPTNLCVVYVAINKNNNKLYVGATKVGMSSRRRSHFYCARRGEKGRFYTAIRKHGEQAFEFVTFARCRNFQHALEIERKLIKAIRPEYNLTEGGGGAEGRVVSQEARDKISRANLGKPGPRLGVKVLDSTKQKNSEITKVWWENKRLDPNYKEFCSDRYKKSSYYKYNESRKRKVICLDDGKIFSCVTEAAAFYGVHAWKVIYSCERPNYKPRKGVVRKFKYVGSLQ